MACAVPEPRAVGSKQRVTTRDVSVYCVIRNRSDDKLKDGCARVALWLPGSRPVGEGEEGRRQSQWSDVEP